MPKKSVRVKLKEFEDLYESNNTSSFSDMVQVLRNDIGNNNAIVAFEDEKGNVEEEHYFDSVEKFEAWVAENYVMNGSDTDGFFE